MTAKFAEKGFLAADKARTADVRLMLTGYAYGSKPGQDMAAHSGWKRPASGPELFSKAGIL